MVLSVIKRRRQMVPHAHARHTATSTTVPCHGETFGGTPEKMQVPRQQEASSQAAPGWRGPTESNAGRKGPLELVAALVGRQEGAEAIFWRGEVS